VGLEDRLDVSYFGNTVQIRIALPTINPQKRRMMEKLQLKLPFDQYATPVNAYDVARAVFELIVNDKSGVYNINSTDYLNRVELAEKILSHFPEAKYDMEKISTADLQQPAQRPLKGGLKNDKFMNEFPEFMFTTVDEYLDKFVT